MRVNHKEPKRQKNDAPRTALVERSDADDEDEDDDTTPPRRIASDGETILFAFLGSDEASDRAERELVMVLVLL